jgi:hypothetical protein
MVYIIQNRSSFCASPSCRPQLHFGLQSLSLAQKETLLLLMIYYNILKILTKVLQYDILTNCLFFMHSQDLDKADTQN